jgi:AMMECR1 domain-containing protein
MDKLFSYIFCKHFQITNTFTDQEIIKLLHIKNCFGVFVTIKRNNKLNTFPYDIHGCIGNYNHVQMKSKTQLELFENIMSVSSSALFRDERRNAFDTELLDDIFSMLEITFMMNSGVIPITSNGLLDFGAKSKLQPYNNETHGIVVYSNTKTATFLPGVYKKSTPWAKIKKNLLSKAGIGEYTEHVFKAYNTIVYSKSLYDIFIYSEQFHGLLRHITMFFNNHYKKCVPYIIQDNTIICKPEEYVRNISTLYSLVSMNQLHKLHKKTLENVKRDIQLYEKKYESGILKSRQSKSFLLLVSQKKIIKNNLCKELALSLPKGNPHGPNTIREYDFELGEVIVALATVCNTSNELHKKIKANLTFMYSNIKTLPMDVNLIFRINWQTQALVNELPNNSRHLQYLFSLLYTYNQTFDISTMETNYVAVTFECLGYLYKYYSEEPSYKRLLFRTLFILQKRFSQTIGLYFFLDNSARIDITCHCIHGFLQILKHL